MTYRLHSLHLPVPASEKNSRTHGQTGIVCRGPDNTLLNSKGDIGATHDPNTALLPVYKNMMSGDGGTILDVVIELDQRKETGNGGTALAFVYQLRARDSPGYHTRPCSRSPATCTTGQQQNEAQGSPPTKRSSVYPGSDNLGHFTKGMPNAQDYDQRQGTHTKPLSRLVSINMEHPTPPSDHSTLLMSCLRWWGWASREGGK
jgi:hypothetical protein